MTMTFQNLNMFCPLMSFSGQARVFLNKIILLAHGGAAEYTTLRHYGVLQKPLFNI